MLDAELESRNATTRDLEVLLLREWEGMYGDYAQSVWRMIFAFGEIVPKGVV